jgi:ATP-dependent DNA helicase RecG
LAECTADEGRHQATRNELIKEVLRDYRYVDARGLGVPRKIIRLMRELNGTETELVEEDDRFVVRLLVRATGRGRQ